MKYCIIDQKYIVNHATFMGLVNEIEKKHGISYSYYTQALDPDWNGFSSAWFSHIANRITDDAFVAPNIPNPICLTFSDNIDDKLILEIMIKYS